MRVLIPLLQPRKVLLFSAHSLLQRSQGHVPSISTSSEKLSMIRIKTMMPSTVTLSNVGSTTMVRTITTP